jgi:hypothetical protein
VLHYEMTQQQFRELVGEEWDVSKFGKLASKLYRELYKKEPPYQRSRAKKRYPLNVYPCGVLAEARSRLCAVGQPCAHHEMTQKEFRRLRGEQWSPSFMSAIGKLATKLYEELYKKAPPKTFVKGKSSLNLAIPAEQRDPTGIYPRGILEQAYRRLIEAGVPIGEPYRQPDPTLKPKKPKKQLPQPVHPAFSFSYGLAREIIRQKIAQRLADIAAGKLPVRAEPDGDDDYTP